MSDFKNLAPVAQASVQVKLDGFIEACILTTRTRSGCAEIRQEYPVISMLWKRNGGR